MPPQLEDLPHQTPEHEMPARRTLVAFGGPRARRHFFIAA
jgi:hypothetical protein